MGHDTRPQVYDIRPVDLENSYWINIGGPRAHYTKTPLLKFLTKFCVKIPERFHTNVQKSSMEVLQELAIDRSSPTCQQIDWYLQKYRTVK